MIPQNEYPFLPVNKLSQDLSNFNEWASEVVRFRDSETVKIARSVDRVQQVLEDICAFANSGKGALYFGVDDDGFAIGDTVYNKKPKKLMTAIFLHISPPLFPRIQIKDFDGRKVVCADIIQTPDKPYFLDGKYFKRMGATNLSLFPHEIKIFMHARKTVERYDSTAIIAYPGGINQERFDWYLSKVDFGDLYSSETQFDEHEIMQKLGLLSQNKINTAAILCFGIGIQETLPQASIICQRVNGTDETGNVIRNEKITGDLFNQCESTQQFLTQNMTQTSRPGEDWGEKRQVITMLATEMLLEAVVHRDYSMKDPIALLIFNDHIEIIIPGGLTKWYSNHTSSQEEAVIPPNPLLAKLFYLSGHLTNWLPSLAHYDEILDEYSLPPLELFSHLEYTAILLRWERERTGTAISRQEEEAQVYAVSTEDTSSQNTGRHQRDSYTPAILQFCRIAKSRGEIQDHIGIKDRKHFRQSILQPILKQNLLAMTIPSKPNSPRQQYKTTPRGEQWFRNITS